MGSSTEQSLVSPALEEDSASIGSANADFDLNSCLFCSRVKPENDRDSAAEIPPKLFVCSECRMDENKEAIDVFSKTLAASGDDSVMVELARNEAVRHGLALAPCATCGCRACANRRKTDGERRMLFATLQKDWVAVRQAVRCMYRNGFAANASEKSYDFPALKAAVSRLCEQDAHQLYQRLEAIARQNIMDAKVHLLHIIVASNNNVDVKSDDGGSMGVTLAGEFVRALLQAFSDLQSTVQLLQPVLKDLNVHYLERLGLTWRIANHKLFDEIIISDPLVQATLLRVAASLDVTLTSRSPTPSEWAERSLDLERINNNVDTLDSARRVQLELGHSCTALLRLMKASRDMWRGASTQLMRFADKQRSLYKATMHAQNRMLKEDVQFFVQQRLFLEDYMAKSRGVSNTTRPFIRQLACDVRVGDTSGSDDTCDDDEDVWQMAPQIDSKNNGPLVGDALWHRVTAGMQKDSLGRVFINLPEDFRVGEKSSSDLDGAGATDDDWCMRAGRQRSAYSTSEETNHSTCSQSPSPPPYFTGILEESVRGNDAGTCADTDCAASYAKLASGEWEWRPIDETLRAVTELLLPPARRISQHESQRDERQWNKEKISSGLPTPDTCLFLKLAEDIKRSKKQLSQSDAKENSKSDNVQTQPTIDASQNLAEPREDNDAPNISDELPAGVLQMLKENTMKAIESLKPGLLKDQGVMVEIRAEAKSSTGRHYSANASSQIDPSRKADGSVTVESTFAWHSDGAKVNNCGAKRQDPGAGATEGKGGQESLKKMLVELARTAAAVTTNNDASKLGLVNKKAAGADRTPINSTVPASPKNPTPKNPGEPEPEEPVNREADSNETAERPAKEAPCCFCDVHNCGRHASVERARDRLRMKLKRRSEIAEANSGKADNAKGAAASLGDRSLDELLAFIEGRKQGSSAAKTSKRHRAKTKKASHEKAAMADQNSNGAKSRGKNVVADDSNKSSQATSVLLRQCNNMHKADILLAPSNRAFEEMDEDEREVELFKQFIMETRLRADRQKVKLNLGVLRDLRGFGSDRQ